MSSTSKNLVLASRGRPAWYGLDQQGQVNPVPPLIIGIAGGSASGKTRVAQQILRLLKVEAPWVLVISQDSFYKELTPEQSAAAFRSEYDFDSPASFDFDVLRRCIEDLKANRAVHVPQYSFTLHKRTEKTTYLYGATVVILEGLFVLHEQETRDLLDLKIFIQCDSDLMLARRLRRDIVERGRSVEGVLSQYLQFVKPSFDAIISPSARFADVIVPGGINNDLSISLIGTHCRAKMSERTPKLRNDLFNGNDSLTDLPLPENCYVIPSTPQIQGIQTILRDETTGRVEFIAMADRLAMLLIESALEFLPYRPRTVTSPTGARYDGRELAVDDLCGISIVPSGSCLEKGLRRVIEDVVLGSVLIQDDATTGEPELFFLKLPPCLTVSRTAASNAYVLLLDSQVGTGAAGIMAIKILLDHGVQESRILLCSILAARSGVASILRAFPSVRIVTSACDPDLEERFIANKKTFVILPGMGSFERYSG